MRRSISLGSLQEPGEPFLTKFPPGKHLAVAFGEDLW